MVRWPLPSMLRRALLVKKPLVGTKNPVSQPPHWMIPLDDLDIIDIDSSVEGSGECGGQPKSE